MHRVDADGHVANQFVDGDPEIPQEGTLVAEKWLNAVQEELCNAIEDGGITLDDDDNEQLSTLLSKIPNVPYTGYGYATAVDFKAYNDGGGATSDYVPGSGSTPPSIVLHNGGTEPAYIEFRVPLPAGATITAIDFNIIYANGDPGFDTLEAYTLTKSATHFTALEVKNGDCAFPETDTVAWRTVASITSRTVPEDGFLHLKLAHGDPDHDLEVYACRVTYTLTVFKPAP